MIAFVEDLVSMFDSVDIPTLGDFLGTARAYFPIPQYAQLCVTVGVLCIVFKLIKG